MLMNEGMVLDIAKEAIAAVLWITLPVLILALVVGLAVSLFQTITSIQEPTLAFVPKILAVFIGLILFGPFMMHKMIEYTIKLYSSFNSLMK